MEPIIFTKKINVERSKSSTGQLKNKNNLIVRVEQSERIRIIDSGYWYVIGVTETLIVL